MCVDFGQLNKQIKSFFTFEKNLVVVNPEYFALNLTILSYLSVYLVTVAFDLSMSNIPPYTCNILLK